MMTAFVISEKTAEFHDGAARGVGLFSATQVNAVDVIPFVAGAVNMMPVRKKVWAYVPHRRAALGNGAAVFICQWFAAHLFRRQVACSHADFEFEYDERSGTEASKNICNGAIETCQDRAYTDDCAGANDHAEHGQECSQLVAPDSVERHADAGKKSCAGHFSARRASMGSRRAARCAGYIPKNRPTLAERATLISTA